MSNVRLNKITVENGPLTIQKGSVRITDTTDNTNGITGAVVINGGVAISNTSDALSSTRGGGITVSGGISAAKSVYVGKNLTLDNPTGVFSVNGISNIPRFLVDTTANGQITFAPDGANNRLTINNGSVSVNITTNSINGTTGSIITAGGVTIQSTETSTSITSGGALTINGGASIGKDASIGKTLNLGESIVIGNANKSQVVLNDNISSSGSINVNSSGNLEIFNKNNLNVSSLTNIDLRVNGTIQNSITQTTTSINNLNLLQNTNGNSLVVSGNAVFNSTTDAFTNNSGSIIVGGGVGISKKLIIGDTLGTDILNPSKLNKISLYNTSGNASESNAFTGIGNQSGGSLAINLSNTQDSLNIYSNGTNQLLKIKGTNEVVFSGSNQSYSIRSGGLTSNDISFQANSNANASSINFFTADGDKNDSNDIKIFGLGTNQNTTNTEYLKIGWDTSNYIISTNQTGNGTRSNLVLNGILTLSTNGNVNINSTRISVNATTASLIVSGGISISNTADSTSISQGGAFTVNGGASFLKNVYIGDTLNFTNGTLKYSNNNLFSSLIVSGSDLNNEIKISNTSAGSKKLSLYTLGENETDINYEILQMKDEDNLGYSISSKNEGDGNSRYIKIFSGTNDNQIMLQTSGNVGINTSNPQFSLDVNGTLSNNEMVVFSNMTTSNVRISGGVVIYNTEDASSNTTSSLMVFGGVNIHKRLNVSGNILFANTTTSINASTASLVVGGGIGCGNSSNSVSFTQGGALTVNGGASVSNDFYAGNNLFVRNKISVSNLSINSTTNASDTSGAIVVNGGINILNTNNSMSVSSGNSLTVAGGASIAKDIYIGGDQYVYGISNYIGGRISNFYDLNTFQNFSVDVTNDYVISRYNNIGQLVESALSISRNTGLVTINKNLLNNGSVIISSSTNVVSSSGGGALAVYGGFSASLDAIVGGSLLINSTKSSSNGSTGALIVNGGVGIKENLNVIGDTVLNGNLTVKGTTTTVDTINTTLQDNLLVINSGPSGSSDSGFIIDRYQLDNNTGSGDVVSDNPAFVVFLPDQTGINSNQVKLSIGSSNVDNFYKGWWIKVITGFNNQQVRKIVSYNGTTKIAVLSSDWFSQNPSIGDTLYLYNKPFVGVVYNEINDRFEFGATTQDPGASNVSFTDNIPIFFSSGVSTATSGSLNSTSGSFVVKGGISISGTNDALSSTVGGGLTVAGGASIQKTLYVGDNLVVNNVNLKPNSEDIFSSKSLTTSLQTTAEIPDLAFSNNVSGGDIYLTANVNNSLYANFHIRIVNKQITWDIAKSYVGDSTGLDFIINNIGQISYTYTGTNGVSCIFKYRVFVN